MKEYLKDSGIDAEYYSMLGTYTDKENARQLENFESEDENKTKFMIVMNKANEGLHVKGVDGIIWFRALDENSRINIPGIESDKNWSWKLIDFKDLAERIKDY